MTQNDSAPTELGLQLKSHRSDFMFCEYETRPDVTVESIQQMRAVWNSDRWEFHFVCKVEIQVADAPSDKIAGISIDIGIKNYLAIAYDGKDTNLYLGNVLKQDKHHFTREEYDTEGENAALLLLRYGMYESHWTIG